MEEGEARLEPRVARIESDVASIKEAVARIDKRVDRLDEKVDERFAKVDARFNGLDVRMAAMEQGFENLKENQAILHVDLRDLRNSLDIKFVWIVTTMIAFAVAILGAMAKGFHWLK